MNSFYANAVFNVEGPLFVMRSAAKQLGLINCSIVQSIDPSCGVMTSQAVEDGWDTKGSVVNSRIALLNAQGCDATGAQKKYNSWLHKNKTATPMGVAV